jgi:hypothetical protein
MVQKPCFPPAAVTQSCASWQACVESQSSPIGVPVTGMPPLLVPVEDPPELPPVSPPEDVPVAPEVVVPPPLLEESELPALLAKAPMANSTPSNLRISFLTLLPFDAGSRTPRSSGARATHWQMFSVHVK